MAQPKVRIATRKSPLALWQACYVKQQLEYHHPNLVVELIPMSTQGDKILDVPLAKIGGKGLFVKELEHAILEGRADIAVHSMKDLPVEFPAGLGLQTICQRANPYDAFVSNHYAQISELPSGAVVGTSSLRRQCQLKALRPDLTIRDLRGNVNTRLAKLDAGEYDAIILAAAGLIRLEMSSRIRTLIAPENLLPANGQGAVGIECRSNDSMLHQLLAPLDHAPTRAAVLAERALNRQLNGGCQVPIGAFAIVEGEELWLRALVGSLDGQEILRAEVRGPSTQSEFLGKQLAQQLLASGADRLLAAAYAK